MKRIVRRGEGATHRVSPITAPFVAPGIGVTLRVGPAARMEAALEAERGKVLMAVRHGGTANGLRDADHPFIDVPTPVLCGASRVEVGTDTPTGNGRLDFGRFDLLNIHVRHREHFAAIREVLGPRLGPSTPAIYLEADLCRTDLLVEIEGVSLSRIGP